MLTPEFTVSRQQPTGDAGADELFEDAVHTLVHAASQSEAVFGNTTVKLTGGGTHTGRLVGPDFVRPDNRHAGATQTGLAVAFADGDGIIKFPLYSVLSLEFG